MTWTLIIQHLQLAIASTKAKKSGGYMPEFTPSDALNALPTHKYFLMSARTEPGKRGPRSSYDRFNNYFTPKDATEEEIDYAISNPIRGISGSVHIRATAKKYNIDYDTLLNRIKERANDPRNDLTLNHEEDNDE
jgi:hypothetical protein